MARDPTAFLHRMMPFCATMGFEVAAFDPENVTVTVGWAPGLCTSNGILHGGVVMALADAAGGACAFLNLPEGAPATTTIESKTNFLAGVKSGSLAAVATPLHVGSTTIVVETSVRQQEDGRLVAKVTQTQAVLRPRPAS